MDWCFSYWHVVGMHIAGLLMGGYAVYLLMSGIDRGIDIQ